MKNITLIVALIISTSFFVGCGDQNAGSGTANADTTQVAAADTSQAPEGDDRFSEDFELFAAAFLNSNFWGQNIDSLVHAMSPGIRQYLHKDFQFGRYWNEGVYCTLYHDEELGYHFSDDFHGNPQPQNKGYSFFKDKMPDDGFCDASPSPDGIYYQMVTKFPQYQDPSIDDDPNRDVAVPAQFKNAAKMEMKVLIDKYVIKNLYFIQIEGIWYLTYFYDCDCSA
jgi:hypothetical protein